MSDTNKFLLNQPSLCKSATSEAKGQVMTSQKSMNLSAQSILADLKSQFTQEHSYIHLDA